MCEKLRYACIGAGGIARKKHLNGYSKLPQVALTAICDFLGRRLAHPSSPLI